MKTALTLLLLTAATLAEPVVVAVARDGTLLRKTEMVLDRKAEVIRRGRREYPLDGFYLVEGANGKLLWTSDYTSRMRGYEFLARDEVREAAEKLLRRALAYRDQKTARKLFDIAQDHGLAGSKTESARKKLLALEKKGSKPLAKAKTLPPEIEKLTRIHTDLLLARAQLELAQDEKRGLVMLRDILRLNPMHEGALVELRKRAPKRFPLGNARVWLDWHLEVERHGAKFTDSDTFNMRQARKYWRKDLHGIEIGPILVITPVTDARTLGRMLGCCAITSNILASFFADYPKRRKKVDPLRIFLYESREEYKKESTAFKPRQDTSFLKFSAGHYSGDEGISRLFWVRDRTMESRIVGTAVHELVHHWLADANPAYNHVEGRRSARTPGFWIIEGIAEFMSEGVYDLDTGAWSLFDRRAPSLDTVHTLAPSKILIPWRLLLTGSAVEFWALPKEIGIDVRRRWSLGGERVSVTHLWYMQSAAVCHYLYHAENGKHRKALAKYIVDHYTRQRGFMDIKRAFGMTPEELGRRVEAYATKVAKGWEPTR